MKYYCEDSQQVLQELNSQKSGLTEKEAAERLLQNGANELKAAKGKSLLRRFAEQVADPMIVILLAAAAISGVLAVLENDSFADVIIILAVVLINAVLGVYQESKAEKAIEALQDMAAATSKVVRDGKMSSILSKDLVVGDIICLVRRCGSGGCKDSGKRKPESGGSCTDRRIRAGHEADRSDLFGRRGTGCASW